MAKIPEEARQFQPATKLGELLGLNHATIIKSFSRSNGRTGGYQFERRDATDEERGDKNLKFVYRAKSRAKMGQGKRKKTSTAPQKAAKVEITADLLEWQPASALSHKINQDRDQLIQASQRGTRLGGHYSVIRREMSDEEKSKFPGKFLYRITEKPGTPPKKAQSYEQRIKDLIGQLSAQDEIIDKLSKEASREPSEFEQEALEELGKAEKVIVELNKSLEDAVQAKAAVDKVLKNKRAEFIVELRKKQEEIDAGNILLKKTKILWSRYNMLRDRFEELEKERGVEARLLDPLLNSIEKMVEDGPINNASKDVIIEAFGLTRKLAGLRQAPKKNSGAGTGLVDLKDLAGEDFFEGME